MLHLHLSVFAALLRLQHVSGATNPPAPSPSDVHLSNEWAGTQYFAFWELGQFSIDDPDQYSACYPQSSPGQPLTNYPCTGLQYFFANCSYGISLTEATKADGGWINNPFTPKSLFTPLTNASQQACYCSGDYWEYVRACDACMMDHGYEPLARSSGDQVAVWLPPQYIDEQSSSYCSNEPTMQALDFFASFTPVSTVDVETEAPSTTLAASITAVSAYATLTHTVIPPTQTSQIGSLAQTAPPAATTSSSTSDSCATYKPGLVAWIAIFIGFVALLA